MKRILNLFLIICFLLTLSSCEKNIIGEISIGNEKSSLENSVDEVSSESERGSEQAAEETDIPEKINKDDWNLILVDRDNKIADDYTVITGTIPIEYIINNNANKIDQRVLAPLLEMLDAAQSEGVKICVTSAYRDIEYQENLFSKQIEKNIKAGLSQEEAEKHAAEYVAIPGTSEHNTGLAVDLVSADWYIENDDLYTTFEDTQEAKWLFENADRYGFILSFPEDKVEITKITYEPWHYRYVGVEHAKIIKDKNFVLEEYLYFY